MQPGTMAQAPRGAWFQLMQEGPGGLPRARDTHDYRAKGRYGSPAVLPARGLRQGKQGPKEAGHRTGNLGISREVGEEPRQSHTRRTRAAGSWDSGGVTRRAAQRRGPRAHR